MLESSFKPSFERVWAVTFLFDSLGIFGDKIVGFRKK